MEKKILKKRYLYYTILLCISFIVISMAIWQEYSANKLFDKYKPVFEKISTSQKEIILSHLWLEELLEGDKSINYEKLIKRFESTLLDTKYDPKKTKIINKKINQLIDFTKQRYKNNATSGTIDDQRYDTLFKNIIKKLDLLKLAIEEKRKQDIKKQNQRTIFIFTLYTLLLITFFIIIYLIEKDLNKTLKDNKKKDLLLLEQSKLASLGEMIGNIAHQWRQPLSVMTTGASGIKLKHEYNQLDGKFLVEICDTIVDNGEYLSQTIDDFRNYIKKDPDKKRFEVTHTITNALKLLKGCFSNHNIEYILNYKKDDFEIKGIENELLQVLMNILTNSKDALVQNNPIENRTIFIDMEKREKRKEKYILLEIYDNAGGIRPDTIEKIFEPYFTTKHSSLGTGLGLYMTYNIITGHFKGTISAQNYKFNHDGKNYLGAKFLIKIPLDQSK